MKKLFRFSYLFFIIFFANTTLAANLNLSPSSGSFGVGDTINVRVVLSSTNQSANAVSGNISFSKDILTLNSVSKSNSLISLWAQEPAYSNANGTVSMEGVILNGYSGSNGTIVTLSFRAKATGDANVKFTSSSVLANDGQGTNILSSSGQANFTIVAAKEKPAPVVPTAGATKENEKVKEKVKSLIKIEEIKKNDALDNFAKFLVSSSDKKLDTDYVVEIDGIVYDWLDQESNIFETTSLGRGTHTIKVSMTTINDEVVSTSLSFSINSILVPKFTEYSDNIRENEYIVIKGVADPNVDIIVNVKSILNGTNQIFSKELSLKSDDTGLFTYVSEKAAAGVYNITAYSRLENGLESESTLPTVLNVSSAYSPLLIKIMNTFSLLIPITALLISLVVLAIWGWYKALHYNKYFGKRLAKTRNTVSKSFRILDEDVKDEVKIFRKIKASENLTNEERLFINQFKKDIEAAEQTIMNDIE